ncbi:8-amino-7-oxononanoate synthase [Roseovarius sp. M141]|uniref:8-amino-7-oxononanoate synthase n=1 Tax=Roseovarius sp. M141 TaxID=2583806 RepID=UPI0020CD3B2F|nr:8-amino-7-oxononanoate synthase [Roseovarius sp. M141]MCQ0091967.1 8-amino-7-oxononanoate synthase [Roseovarius sp. M141]
MTTQARIGGALDALASRHRLRALAPQTGLDFASNDYLGLAGSTLLADAAQEALARGVPVGAGGSRLLRGNHPEHEAVEAEAAAFFGTQAALFMGGGFQANQAIFASLPAAQDLILHDALIHASAIEGMRLGRAATRAFPHNDIGAAMRSLAQWRGEGGRGQVWIAVESVYSMEGDVAPLADLAQMAREEGAVLVVDEAHATGVFGAEGRGLADRLDAQVLTLHTCGKALGVAGGLICGAKVMIDMLINRARPFVFATAPSPLNAALVRAALRALQSHPDLILEAGQRVAHAHAEARRLGVVGALHSQIIPVVIGADQPTMMRAKTLQNMGFDVRGIRPPTVPRGTSRLRISITGNIDHAQVTALFMAIADQQREVA